MHSDGEPPADRERPDREPPRGLFVTLEGPDGSGKSTQAQRVGARLESAGLRCLVTREPGGTAVGERVRDIVLHASELSPVPAAEALLFSAARAQLVREVIEPALRRGETVICDRYVDSTLAYQGYGAGADLDALRAVGRFATGGLRPDVTILIDLPIEDGLSRKVRDDEVTRFETHRDVAFHRRVHEGYLALAAAEPERFVVVDGCASPEAIETAIVEALLSHLPHTVAVALGLVKSSEPDRLAPRMDR